MAALLSHTLLNYSPDANDPYVFTEAHRPDGTAILCGFNTRAVEMGHEQTQSLEELSFYQRQSARAQIDMSEPGHSCGPYDLNGWGLCAVAFHIEASGHLVQHVERLRVSPTDGAIEHNSLILNDGANGERVEMGTKRHKKIADVQRNLKNAADWARNAGAQGAITHPLDTLIACDPNRLYAQLLGVKTAAGRLVSPQLNNPRAALAF
ncbi:hypothetical protein J7355_15705 [Endozoicomonas sp. G2_2]|uniref:hypothetical protein n=1 Tax=Endozoicomonas sp. G2_2 TaxID=2821092 RepID=UPI001ADA2793|nr:hypothetical protein [Endozoicomonas sp. G2_2]MBO9471535.1 hypothetical protein [Endozoicomonas sp. G2_2]